jgi:hypothetical protein
MSAQNDSTARQYRTGRFCVQTPFTSLLTCGVLERPFITALVQSPTPCPSSCWNNSQFVSSQPHVTVTLLSTTTRLSGWCRPKTSCDRFKFSLHDPILQLGRAKNEILWQAFVNNNSCSRPGQPLRLQHPVHLKSVLIVTQRKALFLSNHTHVIVVLASTTSLCLVCALLECSTARMAWKRPIKQRLRNGDSFSIVEMDCC